VTDRRTVWYDASEAVPLNARVPLAGVYDPLIPAWGMNARTSSPGERLFEIQTVAPNSVLLSGSVRSRFIVDTVAPVDG
jgi:hypothetical protein